MPALTGRRRAISGRLDTRATYGAFAAFDVGRGKVRGQGEEAVKRGYIFPAWSPMGCHAMVADAWGRVIFMLFDTDDLRGSCSP